jgi:hypothetical protein
VQKTSGTGSQESGFGIQDEEDLTEEALAATGLKPRGKTPLFPFAKGGFK